MPAGGGTEGGTPGEGGSGTRPWVWTPGSQPPKPPRPRWFLWAGIGAAILAQVGLYFMLKQIAVAYRPAWAMIQHVVHGPVSVTILPPEPPSPPPGTPPPRR
ncbi:hypothetical protein [Rhizosaccharibacter radicis]|uniref:Energy transducer TonB n=1 Tax=Rhizosaccharibacter radicis TaxID=2782605 RepID=A0ABT1VZX0_9PROT|nr:hypothetical protein [Acetobacteraceae bacterium KSS12]